MKVPLSWLKEYLDLTSIPLPTIAETLTMAGIEVEGMSMTPLSFSGVVVGEVVETSPHPQADRLTIATVSDGTERFQVVCGAPNCKAGLRVAFAKMGAILTGEEGKEFKIKKGKLRDVESFGMLCGASELNLPGDNGGLLELDSALALGTDLASLYTDTILDISLTPNLGHCLSIEGLARELGALLDLPLKKSLTVVKEEGAPIESFIQVQLLDKKQCHRYSCRVVSDVKVGPSPQWLKTRIELCGLRSVNNIVDIGNYVLLATGQPLHMFDHDKISGKKLLITSHTDYKNLETLDGQTREIFPEIPLICDDSKPLALAGVIGGKGSAITPETTRIVIESAAFTPMAIRKSAKLLNLKTDASQRFEKGIDPNQVVEALNLAADLVSKCAGGAVSKGVIDEKIHPFLPKKIHCRTYRVNGLLGTKLSTGEITGFLEKMGMKVVEEGPETLLVSVPTYRNDLSIEVDLIEEIAKLYGYSHLMPKEPPKHVTSSLLHTPMFCLEKKARIKLLSEGLQEFLTCDLISPEQATLVLENTLKKDSLISVLQPSSVQQSVMRPSLLPGLLEVIRFNADRGKEDCAGFEIGRVHLKNHETYIEPTTCAVILSGNATPYHFDPKPRPWDFFDLKGICENFLASLKIAGCHFETSHLHHFHPGRQAKIKQGERFIGSIGEVHPEVLRLLGISARVYFAELNLSELSSLVPKQLKATEIPLFPGSVRDWTVTLPDEQPIEPLLTSIRKAASPLLESVILLDLYKSDQIGKDRKNVTLRFLYRDKKKTISFEAVEKEHGRITQATLSF